ncbi:MAG: hypothetical protein CL675_14050 [Bdellovibrionaceae bacterium]|jgi:DNA-binding Lrp family transcriptional regulator|nr:hypothetical protein [Pseudobdellovibrionaceae bacterium]
MVVTGVSARSAEASELRSNSRAIDKVLFALASNPNISQRIIQTLTGLSNRSVRYALEELKSRGIVSEFNDLRDIRKKKYRLIKGGD